MPDIPLDVRPDYGFDRLDRWLADLARLIPDLSARSAVLQALEENGRQLDVDELAHRYQLSRPTTRLVGQLARFGDRRLPVHAFASVHVAEISAPSAYGPQSLATYLLATRRADHLEYWWADAADGFGVLGMRDLPLSFIEAVIMVEATVVAQGALAIIDGADRSGYRLDRLASMRISSRFYPALARWFRQAR